MEASALNARKVNKSKFGSLEFRAVILTLIAICVYANSLPNEFTLDDGLYITENPQVTQPSFHSIVAPHKASNTFRPVTFASYALQWVTSGARPMWFHLVNVLLHASVTILLYLLLRKLLTKLAQAEILSFATALLFAVHPIHTEAVANVVGRAELFAAGFILAAWFFHLQDWEISALLCFGLALLSKESAVVFIGLALAGDFALENVKPAMRYVWLLSVTIFYIALLWVVQGHRFGQSTISKLDNPLAELPPFWRVMNACRVAWKYVALQFYPARLSSDYSFNEIAIHRDLGHTLPATLGVLAVVIACIWGLRSRHRMWALSGAIYLTGFATTANILLPTGTVMGERLAYLPSSGLCLFFAFCWVELLKREKGAAIAALVIVAGALGARTVSRNRDWHDDFSLAKSAVLAAPGSAKAHTKLGDMYLSHQQNDMAREEFDAALKIYPGLPDTLADYGLLEFREGNYEKAGQMMEAALNTSDRSNSNYDFMTVNYAGVLLQTGHTDAALDLLNQETKEAPKYARAWSNRAVIYYKRGDNAAARSDAQTALRLDPTNLQAVKVLQIASRPAALSTAENSAK